MVNLIAGKQIVPELVQNDFTSDNVVKDINQILHDGPARDQMIAGLVEVKSKLYGPDHRQIQPADRAAAEIMGALNSLRTT
jgi:lipid-A-disaccharide synthase